MYKLPAALLVLICTVLTLWWINIGKFNRSERDLFARLENTLAVVPPSASKIASEFGFSKDCATKTCFFNASKLADVSYGSGNLRPSGEGLVFVLEELDGQCIRSARAADRFGLGEVKQVCDHGGCWFREVQHDWGILGFGLKKPGSSCVSSLVINSLPEQRQVH